MKLRHVPHLSRSPGIGPVEYVPLAAEHARCFLERFFADEEGIVFFNTNLPPLVVFFLFCVYSHSGSSVGRCEKIPSTRGFSGKEMKHLPPFMTHREVYTYYLREPADTTMGRHVSIFTFNRVWAKYFSNVVTPKTKRFSQCDICSQVKEFRGRNIEVEVQKYQTVEEQNAHREKYSDRAKYIADLKNFHFQRVSTHPRPLPFNQSYPN